MGEQSFTFDSNLSSEGTYDYILLSFEKVRAILWEMLAAHELDSKFRKTYVLLSILDDMLENIERLFENFCMKIENRIMYRVYPE